MARSKNVSPVSLTKRSHTPNDAACASFQGDVEAALEALSTLIDVSVGCDTGLLCNDTRPSTCTVEFLTELGDVPLISASVTSIDSLAISEYQVTKPFEMPRCE